MTFPTHEQIVRHMASVQNKNDPPPQYPETLEDAADRLISEIGDIFEDGNKAPCTYVDVKLDEVYGLRFDPMNFINNQPATTQTDERLGQLFHEAFMPLLLARIDSETVVLHKFSATISRIKNTCRLYVDLQVMAPAASYAQ